MNKNIVFLGFIAFVALTLNSCCAKVYVINDRVRDLEMENAALRAANHHLLELGNVRR